MFIFILLLHVLGKWARIFSTIVQISVKADHGKAIARRSASWKMHVITYQTKKLFRFSVYICTHSAVRSLHFIPSLQFVSGLQSAVCILYTNKYPWHQYSLFLVTVIRTTHKIYHKIPICELIRHFRSFPR